MKRFIIYFLLSSFISLCGCEEEYVGQYPVDNVAPGKITNISVENFPGGSSITYNLPEEKDLLCVKARYTLQDGRKMEQSASAYLNKVTLKGFGKMIKTTVDLVTIDKSHNESQPVRVEIEPLDSPIYEVFESLEYFESFGGLKLSWNNINKEVVVLGLLIKNEDGDYQEIETIYSSLENMNTSIRGLEAEETEFGFYFRDSYDNYTDTIYDVLTPFFEEELDKSRFRAFPLPDGVSLYGSSYPMTKLWDEIHGAQYQNFYIRIGEVDPFFSFDMGVKAKLSRFKTWQRNDQLFRLHNPRYFEIWGTNDETKVGDPNNWDGWFKIGEFESKRPSGLEAGEPLTQEDVEYAMAGEEFEVPIDAPAFRYFRMYVYNPYNPILGGSWSGTRGCHIEEITIWGAIENE
jgi:hypothetical protein